MINSGSEVRAHLAAIGCNGQEISRAHLAAIGCNGLMITKGPIESDIFNLIKNRHAWCFHFVRKRPKYISICFCYTVQLLKVLVFDYKRYMCSFNNQSFSRYAPGRVCTIEARCRFIKNIWIYGTLHHGYIPGSLSSFGK